MGGRWGLEDVEVKLELALSGAAGVEDRQDFDGRQGAVVEFDLVDQPIEEICYLP